MSTHIQEPISPEEAADTVRLAGLLLANNRINPRDQWHCEQLLHRTPGVELTQANLKWLGSLVKRSGERFKGP